MQTKCLKLMIGFISRYDSGSNDAQEDFLTVSKRWIKKDEKQGLAS